MIKFLNQECIRKIDAECAAATLTFKLKHGQTSISMDQVQIGAQRVSYIGSTHIIAIVMDTTTNVIFIFIFFIIFSINAVECIKST